MSRLRRLDRNVLLGFYSLGIAGLARALRASDKTVRRELLRNGFDLRTPFRRRILIPREILLREVFIRGQNQTQAAKALGVSRNTIRKELFRQNLPFPDPKRTGGQNKSDLTGRVVGRLTVLNEVGRIERHVVWRCACQCGKTAKATSSQLNARIKKSCGCLRKRVS